MFGQCSAKLGTLQTNSNNFGQLQASSNPFYWQERLALQVTYTPLGREETLSWETESLEKQDFLISCQSLGTQFLNAWCLMVHGSWLMAKGGRSGPGARGSAGAGPGRTWRSLGPQGRTGPPWPWAMSHEPWAMSHEPSSMHQASSIKHQGMKLWSYEAIKLASYHPCGGVRIGSKWGGVGWEYLFLDIYIYIDVYIYVHIYIYIYYILKQNGVGWGVFACWICGWRTEV